MSDKRLNFSLSAKQIEARPGFAADHLAGPFNSQMPAQVAQAELRKLHVSGTCAERFPIEIPIKSGQNLQFACQTALEYS